jgi:cytoskeletal protein CcmA (bactofilin family)
MFLLSMAIFITLFAMPLLAGFLEIVHPNDDGRLAVDNDYTRDPRFFGNSFRAKIASLLAEDRSVPRTEPFLGRTDERAHVARCIDVTADANIAEVLLALDRIDIADGATVIDAFGKVAATAGRNVRLRTISSDGYVELGDGTEVERWVDADDRLDVGRGCNLGVSASAGAQARIGSGTSFTRIFGNPVVAIRQGSDAISEGISPDFSAFDGNVIFDDDAQIEAGATIAGSVKAHGRLTIGEGATIAGNVIGRGDVIVGAAARVGGHAFAEGSLQLDRGARVGTPRAAKTAYGATALTLHDGAMVYGWAITDGAGRIA